MRSEALRPGAQAESLILEVLGITRRDQIEDLVENLIDLLDQLDPDRDLEPDDFDCCEAYDDRPGPVPLGCSDPQFAFAAGDPDDAEEDACILF